MRVCPRGDSYSQNWRILGSRITWYAWQYTVGIYTLYDLQDCRFLLLICFTHRLSAMVIRLPITNQQAWLFDWQQMDPKWRLRSPTIAYYCSGDTIVHIHLDDLELIHTRNSRVHTENITQHSTPSVPLVVLYQSYTEIETTNITVNLIVRLTSKQLDVYVVCSHPGHLHYRHFRWKLMKASMEASIASMEVTSMDASMEETSIKFSWKFPRVLLPQKFIRRLSWK